MKDNTSHGRAAKRARIRLGRHDQGRDRIALNALTIKVHRDAIQALLRGEDVDDWRLVRFQLGKPQADDPPQDGGVLIPEDDPYEVDPDLAERWAMEDMERIGKLDAGGPLEGVSKPDWRFLRRCRFQTRLVVERVLKRDLVRSDVLGSGNTNRG